MSLEDFAIILAFLFIVIFEFHWLQKYSAQLLLTLFFTLILFLQSAYVSLDVYRSLVNLCKVVNCFVLFPIVLLYLFKDKRNIVIAKRSYLFSSILSSLIFVLNNSVSLDQRVSSYSGDPVMYSFLLGFAFIIVLFSDKTLFGKFFFFRPILIVIFVFQILLTGSGSGIAILFLAFTVKLFFAQTPFNFGKFALKLNFLILSIWALWTSPLSTLTKDRLYAISNPRTHYDLSAGAGQSSLEARVLSIKYAWASLQDSLIFGRGFYVGDQVTEIGLQPHNFLVLCWLTGGMLGLILSLIFFIQSFSRLSKFALVHFQMDFVITFTTWFGLFSTSIFWDTAYFSCLYIILYGHKSIKSQI